MAVVERCYSCSCRVYTAHPVHAFFAAVRCRSVGIHSIHPVRGAAVHAEMQRSIHGCRCVAFPRGVTLKSPARRPKTGKVRAALDTGQLTAVSQQLASFAVFIAAEGIWAAQRMPDQPGKPNVPLTLAAAGATLAVCVLMQLQALQLPGEIVGLVLSAALMYYYVRRSIDTKDPGEEWPGPKAPPAGMALVAFFSLNIFIQSLRA